MFKTVEEILASVTMPLGAPPAAQLRARSKALLTEAGDIATRALDHGRADLSEGEDRAVTEYTTTAERLVQRAADLVAGDRRAHEVEDSFRSVTGAGPLSGEGAQARYGIAPGDLTAHFEAIREGRTYAKREEFRALLTTTSNTGAPASWASSSAQVGTSLREFAGIPRRPLLGNAAQIPSVTLPTGATGVNESTAHGEFTGVAPASLAVKRYGRWSSVSALIQVIEDLAAIETAHRVGISRDLTKADVGAIDTVASTPTAFDADTFEADLRGLILGVAATVGVDPTLLVVYGKPAAVAVATSIAPTSQIDRGGAVDRVYGARVFPTNEAADDQLTVFAPAAFLAFETGITSAATIAADTGAQSFGQWLHATPVGPAIAASALAIATA